MSVQDINDGLQYVTYGLYIVTTADGEKKNGKLYLKFYQAHYLMAEIPAVETHDDYDQETVHFVKILDNGEKQLKIIFGSIDFNAYSVVDIAE